MQSSVGLFRRWPPWAALLLVILVHFLAFLLEEPELFLSLGPFAFLFVVLVHLLAFLLEDPELSFWFVEIWVFLLEELESFIPPLPSANL